MRVLRPIFLTVLACGASHAALAQSAAAPTDAPSVPNAAPAAAAAGTPARGGLEDIVVTAQRRSQRLQDTPVAVSAFTDNALRQLNVQSPLDVTRYVPNLVAGHNTFISSANTYVLRGLQNTESIATFDPAVGTYVDDIYISRQNVNDFGLFDVDRIEVLRGPQGTLFGRNTTAGAISIILKRPAPEFGGYAEAGYGSYHRFAGRGSINVPLSDTIRTKLDGYVINDDGYARNTQTGERFNRTRNYGVRGAVDFLISPDVTWRLSGDFVHAGGDYLFNYKNGHKRFFDAGVRRGDDFTSLVVGDKQFTKPGSFTDAASATSNLEVRAGGVTINSITGLRFTTQDYNVEAQDSAARFGGFTLVNHTHNFQGSQEFKANGKLFDGALDLTGGVYLFYEKTRTNFADIPNANLLKAQPTTVGRVSADRLLTNDTLAGAAYLQGDLTLATNLIATVGGRFTHEEKTVGVESNRNPLVPATNDITTAGLTNAGIPTKQTTDKFTPRFVLTYKFSPDISVYASATNGFKSGGWNARATNPAAFTTFGPEKTWSYELGFRSELFDRRLRFNVTGFQAYTDDLQQSASFRLPSGSVTFVTRNVGTLNARGVELEAAATPIDGFNIFANLAYLDAKFTDLRPEVLAQQAGCLAAIKNGTSTVGLCGSSVVTTAGTIAKPARSPKWNGSFGANYEIPIGGSGWHVTPGFDGYFTSSYENGTANLRTVYKGVAGSLQKSYVLFNASLRLSAPDDRWSVSLTCTNCTDRGYIIAANHPEYFLGDPRRFEVRLRYKY